MIKQITPEETVATLKNMLRDYRLTVGDCAALLGISQYTLSRFINGHKKPSRLVSYHVAQTAELWKQNPPEPSPERRGGYRGDMCAQRAKQE